MIQHVILETDITNFSNTDNLHRGRAQTSPVVVVYMPVLTEIEIIYSFYAKNDIGHSRSTLFAYFYGDKSSSGPTWLLFIEQLLFIFDLTGSRLGFAKREIEA